MAVKHLLGRPGIGFSPGKVQYLLTRGLEIGLDLKGYKNYVNVPFRDKRTAVLFRNKRAKST